MSNSYLLKDLNGQVRGYLIQAGHSVRCRACGIDPDGISLYLLDEQGLVQCIRPPCLTEEACFETDIAKIGGGFILQGERMVLTTGGRAHEQACKVLQQIRIEQMENSSPGQEVQPAESAKLKMEEGPASLSAHAARQAEIAADLPSGRWPPPPCLPCPRYLQGKWIDLTQEPDVGEGK